MKLILQAVRAAVRQPRRVLACVRACEGVELDVIEVHDHDYNLQHLHDQLGMADTLSRREDARMQRLVGERMQHVAALRSLVAWVDGIGVERFPSFAGMNVQPLLNARTLVGTNAAPAPVRYCGTCKSRATATEACDGLPIQPGSGCTAWEPTVEVVGVDTGEHD